MKKTIKVVGAVIKNDEGQILCALRSPEMTLPNLWEFPGGKIEEGEDPKEALIREIREELGCEIAVGEYVERCVYEYPFAIVDLSCYEAAVVSGVPVAKEHAELVWKEVSELGELEWATADVPIVEELIVFGKKLTNKEFEKKLKKHFKKYPSKNGDLSSQFNEIKIDIKRRYKSKEELEAYVLQMGIAKESEAFKNVLEVIKVVCISFIVAFLAYLYESILFSPDTVTFNEMAGVAILCLFFTFLLKISIKSSAKEQNFKKILYELATECMKEKY